MRNYYEVGTKIQTNHDMNHLLNIDTGNHFNVISGQTGTIVKVNPVDQIVPEHPAMYLIRFDNVPDRYNEGPVTGWVPELDIVPYKESQWYMTIADAAEMVVKAWREDRHKTFAFCESDRYEALGDPTKHRDNGGWHGIKRIDGFFDNEPCEFIAAIGHYGGGNVAFAYVDGEEADDSTCEYALRIAICDATGWDSDNMIYIEEDKKEDK